MRSLILLMLFLLSVVGVGVGQKVDSTVVKTHKKIIIQTMDKEGNVETKVIEDGDIRKDSNSSVWITKGQDSIIVKVFADTMMFRTDSAMFDEFEPFEMGQIEGFGKFFGSENEFPGRGHKMMIFRDANRGFPFGGHGDKAKLGVFIEESFKGVKVTEVEDFSAAYSVGILAGDVITKINGIKITNVQELQREINSRKPGDIVKVKVKRNGKNKNFEPRLHGQEIDMESMELMHGAGCCLPGKGGRDFMFMDNCCSTGKKSNGCGHGNSFQSQCSHGESKCCSKHEDVKKCGGKDSKEHGCCQDKAGQAKCSHGESKCCSKHDDVKKCGGKDSKEHGCCQDKAGQAKCSHGETKACTKTEGQKKCDGKGHEEGGCKNKDKK